MTTPLPAPALQGELTVLFSFPAPHAATNPYIVMLADAVAAEPGTHVRFFSWRTAFLSHYDVFHTHWPELLFSGPGGPKTVVRQVLFLALLLRLRLLGVPLVRTLHNLRPHERKSWIERRLISLTDDRTAGWIRLNPTTVTPAGALATTILHGHYTDWFARFDRPAARRGSVLFAGQVREYKNVPALISAFREVEDPDGRLRVVGKASTAALASSLTNLAAPDGRISFGFGHVSDADLAREIGTSELVVLPYSEMHNSGTALLALSLGRPVLVPSNEVTAALAEEVGARWVLGYPGELQAGDIENALARVRTIPDHAAPDLSQRDWRPAGSAHVGFYRRVRSASRRKRQQA